MKTLLTLGALSTLVLMGGCTTKSYASCDQDVERLKGAIRETAYFMEALEIELGDANKAAAICEDRLDTCMADMWIDRLQQIRLQEADTRARFTRAVEVYQPDACLQYTATYRLNPPPPARYQGYFTNFEQAETEIERLVERFSVFVG